MSQLKITSLSNPHVKEAVAISQKRSTRPNTILIEGERLIRMADSAGALISEVFFTSSFGSRERGVSLLNKLEAGAVRSFEVSEKIISRLSDTDTPQGIVAVVSYKPPCLRDLSINTTALIVVLDSLQDPGNVGTIIRTADALGADAVVCLPGTCDTLSPKVIRASAGSIFNVPVVSAGTEELIAWLRDRGIGLAVTSPSADIPVFDSDLTSPVAFIFGNEAMGVGEALKESADLLISIPLFGKAESLNVATSAAVCLYEALRQRKKHNG